jgi:hypothetical protein
MSIYEETSGSGPDTIYETGETPMTTPTWALSWATFWGNSWGFTGDRPFYLTTTGIGPDIIYEEN